MQRDGVRLPLRQIIYPVEGARSVPGQQAEIPAGIRLRLPGADIPASIAEPEDAGVFAVQVDVGAVGGACRLISREKDQRRRAALPMEGGLRLKHEVGGGRFTQGEIVPAPFGVEAVRLLPPGAVQPLQIGEVVFSPAAAPAGMQPNTGASRKAQAKSAVSLLIPSKKILSRFGIIISSFKIRSACLALSDRPLFSA